jgi:predicted GIY-YIG superfamily endonuclease
MMRTRRRFDRRHGKAQALPDRVAAVVADDMPWQVYVLADAARKRFSISMARDPISRAYRHRQLVPGTDQPKQRTPYLVFTESFACRHTALAKMKRMRLWTAAELKKQIAAANPGMADLYVDPFGEEA